MNVGFSEQNVKLLGGVDNFYGCVGAGTWTTYSVSIRGQNDISLFLPRML